MSKRTFVLIICLIVLIFGCSKGQNTLPNKKYDYPDNASWNAYSLDKTFYIFDIEDFKNEVFAFSYDPASKRNMITKISNFTNNFSPKPPITTPFGRDRLVERGILLNISNEQVRDAYNDKNIKLYLASSGGNFGGIYTLDNLTSVKVVLKSEKHGFRSITKYNNTYVAGTDGEGYLYISHDGNDWLQIKVPNILQTNKFLEFNGWLYIIDNLGITKTKNFVEYYYVFNYPQHKQIYAANIINNQMYIGTGWDENQTGRLYKSANGEDFAFIGETSKSPLPYFITVLNEKIIWGGYASEGVYDTKNNRIIELEKTIPLYKQNLVK